MGRKKSHEERTLMIGKIIELVNERGRITTKDVIAMFGLHRSTAEKYMRMATERGQLVRHGRCGIFRDQRATIDFDLKRFSYNRNAA